MSRLHIADTGLFVAMGQPSTSRYQAVRRFARRNDITFVLSERMYEELTVDDQDVESLPGDDASGGESTKREVEVKAVADVIQRRLGLDVNSSPFYLAV